MLIDRKLKPLASTVAGTVLCDQAITLRSARSRLWWGRRSRLAHHPMTTRFSANGISRSSFGRSRASMTRQASDATLAGMLPRSPLRAPPASDGGEPRRRQRRASDMVLGRRHVAKAQWGPAEPRRETVIAVALGAKKVELLHEMIPKATKIAFLANPNNPGTVEVESPDIHSAAHRLGLELIVLNASTASEIESSLVSAAQQGATGVYIGADAFLVEHREQIAALGRRHTLATMSPDRNAVVAGGLMSYGPSQVEMYRQAGVYVGRILKGDKPADLPVMQATKFVFVINMRTVKALGLIVPPGLLAIADEVIE